MDKDGDGEITKQEFVAHFDSNKGFSPVHYSRTPKVDTLIAKPAKPEERPKGETKDIVDVVLDDIQEIADAHKTDEDAQASAASAGAVDGDLTKGEHTKIPQTRLAIII